MSESLAHIILRNIGSLGYCISVREMDGRCVLIATSEEQRPIEVGGDDIYQAACRLAESVGVDLEDG